MWHQFICLLNSWFAVTAYVSVFCTCVVFFFSVAQKKCTTTQSVTFTRAFDQSMIMCAYLARGLLYYGVHDWRHHLVGSQPCEARRYTISSSCFYWLRQIRRIRRSLDAESAKTRACFHHNAYWRLQYRVGRVAKNHHWQVTTSAECRSPCRQ